MDDGTLGDVMGTLRTAHWEEASFSPLQRVAVTANGNLQRLVSSYYNAEVSVKTRYNKAVAPGLYEREVDLSVRNVCFARCTSTVRVDRTDIVHAIEVEGAAIGQMFRMFDLLPHFKLHGAGFISEAEAASRASKRRRNSEPTTDVPPQAATAVGPMPVSVCDASRDDSTVPRFWREYTLAAEGVNCSIREVLRCDLFELELPSAREASCVASPSMPSDDAVATSEDPRFTPPPSLGDIMGPASMSVGLPPGFTPRQRLLLTANGNVVRLLSSYYGRPVHTHVMTSDRRPPPGHVYDRQVALILDGRKLATAKTTAYVTDETWANTMEHGGVSLGALFRHFHVLPTFTLHYAGVVPGGFFRQYQLKAPGLTLEINENFDEDCFH